MQAAYDNIGFIYAWLVSCVFLISACQGWVRYFIDNKQLDNEHHKLYSGMWKWGSPSMHANDQVEHVMIYFFLNSASCRPLNRGVGYGVEVLHADTRVYGPMRFLCGQMYM